MATPKFCIDCRHFRPGKGTGDDALYWGSCTKESVSDSMYLVSGNSEPQYLTARAQRDNDRPNWCGPSGQWWEPKDTGFTIDKTINGLRGEAK